MTVIQFTPRAKKLPENPLPHLFSVHIYGDGVATDLHIEQPGRPDGTVDMDAFLDKLTQALMFTSNEQFERTGDPNHEILLLTRIYRSSLVATRWPGDKEFETPGQLRWLRRRLTDVYWQIDERRGIQYRVHRFLNDIGRLIARIRGRKNARKSNSSE